MAASSGVWNAVIVAVPAGGDVFGGGGAVDCVSRQGGLGPGGGGPCPCGLPLGAGGGGGASAAAGMARAAVAAACVAPLAFAAAEDDEAASLPISLSFHTISSAVNQRLALPSKLPYGNSRPLCQEGLSVIIS